MSEPIKVDAMGKECPTPVIMTLQELRKQTGEATIVTSVDNQTAVENLQRLGKEKDVPTSVKTIDDKHFEVTFEVGPEGVKAADTDDAFVASCQPGHKRNVVVAITGDTMGQGDDELGKQLMKAFIYALGQQDVLPTTIVFYNKGAQLTCEGSQSLDDLKEMEAQGVEIITCGLCANYFDITDKVKVGIVGNMYLICEKLTKADLVVRP